MKNFANLIALGLITLVVFTGCASTDGDANLGKIGPDYEGTMSSQIRQQEAMSRVMRSLTP